MKAILWDGENKIKGELILEEKRLRFKLVDFSQTDLDFDLAYEEILKIEYHKIYGIHSGGLELLSDQNNKNVFIVESPMELKRAIEQKCDVFDIE